MASRAVSVRRGSTTQTSARSRSARSVFTGSGMATVWPCETTGLHPTYITNRARSRSGRGLRATEPPTRSDTRTLAVPSIVSGLNLAGVPMAACSAWAIR